MKKSLGVFFILFGLALFVFTLMLSLNTLPPMLAALKLSNTAHEWGRICGALFVLVPIYLIAFFVFRAGVRKFSNSESPRSEPIFISKYTATLIFTAAYIVVGLSLGTEEKMRLAVSGAIFSAPILAASFLVGAWFSKEKHSILTALIGGIVTSYVTNFIYQSILFNYHLIGFIVTIILTVLAGYYFSNFKKISLRN